MIIFSVDRVFSTFEPFNRPDNLHGLHAECVGFVHSTIDLSPSLAASPARLRVSQGRTALRSVAHSAMRPHRGVAPGIPVCPPREHVPPRPLRRIALWSVLRGKTIPPLHPSPASGRAVCLLGSGKPTVKTHTHECGSISSGWPPNQPASRIAKLFGEGGAGGEGGPVREGAQMSGAARGKLLRPASRRLRRP